MGAWLNDPFVLAFAGGIAVAVLCGMLSPLVVLKRMAFIGNGIAHSAFGGAGLALLLSLFFPALGPTWARDAIIAAFCVASALGIGFLSRRGRLAEDTSIGICLVAAMALGLLLINIRQIVGVQYFQYVYTPPLESLLFGQILAMSPADVAASWVLAAVVVLAVALTFKELVFFSFDEETAGAFGVPTKALYYGLLVLLALAVVAALRTMGVILASTLLVLPGACGKLLSRRIGAVTLLSVLVAVAGMIVGLGLQLWLDYLVAGPVIALTYVLLLLASYVIRMLRRG